MISCGEKYTLSIKDADKNIALEVGDSKTVVPEYSEGATLVWESSDQNVVTVSNGTINAVKEGSATITVSLKEKSELKVEITVKVTKKEVVIKEFTVKFVGKDGETLKEEKVEEGKATTAPLAPVLKGFVFKRWDKEFNSVTSDLEVKAIYEKVEQPEPEKPTISDVLALEAGSEAEVTATIVVAVNAQSFLIKDATGMILVYEGSSWIPDVKVGDVVKVKGTTASYGGAMQFAAGTAYEVLETAVNFGSDLWYTWQKTAMLVADIMIRNNLDITKVKGHNAFSGKDCPQPMLENDLEIWNEFIEMIKVEYERMSKYKDLSFEIECDNQMVNGVGRVTEQQLTSQVIKYKVTLFNNYTGELEEITLSSIVEGIYAK